MIVLAVILSIGQKFGSAPPPPTTGLAVENDAYVTDYKGQCGKYAFSYRFSTGRNSMSAERQSRLSRFKMMYGSDVARITMDDYLPRNYRVISAVPRCVGADVLYLNTLLLDLDKDEHGSYALHTVAFDRGAFVFYNGGEAVPEIRFAPGSE